jgi:cytidine deaminase
MQTAVNTILDQLRDLLPKSHSPYSQVQVAAAVAFEIAGETKIAYGVNVENVSYGLTVCAERSAVSAAIANGMTSITALYVMSNQAQPISPCGACRQVVTEFMADTQAPVLCVNQARDREWTSELGDLLPNRFAL